MRNSAHSTKERREGVETDGTVTAAGADARNVIPFPSKTGRGGNALEEGGERKRLDLVTIVGLTALLWMMVAAAIWACVSLID
ncbi:hypothetical protein WBP06_19170 [Novosphingobium sp. BL-8H]|uniref:hypothetical protein n=1 Tax=Novosphingobium sp. BL-8H TaxID=3127640 RepID=UPI00375711FB